MRPLRPHEIQALKFLFKGPDRIKTIDDENTFAAAIVFCDLEKLGLVTIDKEDGMLVTINSYGRAALAQSVEKP